MRKGSFPERAAHLSYVAPLIGLLLVQQLGTGPRALLLLGLLLAGGLFAAFTGMRWSLRERGRASRAALLGVSLHVAFVALLLWSLRAQLSASFT